MILKKSIQRNTGIRINKEYRKEEYRNKKNSFHKIECDIILNTCIVLTIHAKILCKWNYF